MTGSAPQLKLAAIILTKNEERDLPGCLGSLQGLATELYVVDSGSTDATLEIARRYGAITLTHTFESHASQLNWALDNISTAADWILRIDADERLSQPLVAELLQTIPQLSSEVTGLVIPRRIRFIGRDLKFGCTYPVWLLRLWRTGTGRCEDRWMDEHILLTSGRSMRVRGELIHQIPKNLTEWTEKHNWYASRACLDILPAAPIESREDIAVGRRRVKQSVYLRLPLFYRAFAYWFYRYFFRLGFLDGRAGLIYHFLQGFWYRFLVDAKLFEMSTLSQSRTPGLVKSAGLVVGEEASSASSSSPADSMPSSDTPAASPLSSGFQDASQLSGNLH